MEIPKEKHLSQDDLCLIVVGMAGSGKTTFVGNLKNYLLEKTDFNVFASNLDPVVMRLPYSSEYDIRKDFNHKEVMKKYKLGPNGAIMTCLNLFCAKIDNFIKQFESIKVNSGLVKPDFGKKKNLETDEQLKDLQKGFEGIKIEAKPQKKKIKNIFLIDTPGQIEAFMWSASGEIISRSIASTMPTVICFVLDRYSIIKYCLTQSINLLNISRDISEVN